ncbi:hypothetical protein GCM10010399_48150 [Dactylosporangium fulvum]
MVSGAVLLDLLRRFVFFDDETVVWSKYYAPHPALAVETSDRLFNVRVVPDLLRVGAAPWVEALVVAIREDQEVEGPAPQDVFLLRTDGEALHLRDPGTVAALGALVVTGDLDPVAYAEVLASCQWPGGWFKQVVTDPAAWRGEYPPEADLPQVEAPQVRDTDDATQLTFFASRQTTEVVGGRPVLDVSRWTVRIPKAPHGAPAAWDCAAVADAVPLAPPW